MLDKKEIGNRLREFAQKNFSSLAEFGRQFNKDRTFFTPYFNGSSVPGGEILYKLAELGCDITWLLLGIKSDESIIMDQLRDRIIELEKEVEENNKNRLIVNLSTETVPCHDCHHELIFSTWNQFTEYDDDDFYWRVAFISSWPPGVDFGRFYPCANCEKEIIKCKNCSHEHEDLCNECWENEQEEFLAEYGCNECDDPSVKDETNWCEVCDKYYCNNHAVKCPGCTLIVCKNCAAEGKGCRETHEVQEDKQSNSS